MAQPHASPSPTRRFTVDEVMSMVHAGILSDDERVELLEGELLIVTHQGPKHASVAAALCDRLRQVYAEGFAVREAKPLVAQRDSLPEPDVAIVRGAQRDFAERHPRGDEALLVIELAHTSLALDHRKAAIYARAAVATYWLADLVNGRLEVHEEPQADGRYRVVRVLAGEDAVTLPGTSIEWRAVGVIS